MAFPPVVLDDVRYFTTNLGVHPWIAHCLFALITCKFDRRQQTQSFGVIQCLEGGGVASATVQKTNGDTDIQRP